MKNLSKFKKTLIKSDITPGFVTPTEWLSTGIYTMNFIMSGRFNVGVPNKRATLLWGPSGTGKSFFSSVLAKEAQEKGYHIIYIDTETAADPEYMEKIGVKVDEDHLTVIPVASMEETTKVMSELFKELDADDKVFIVLDSLSMLLTEKEVGDFDKGVMKGDQGQQAKKLKLFVKNINNKIGNYDAFFVGIGHAYKNQDLLNGEGKWLFSGGDGVQFIPSISVKLTKTKLKDDVDKQKIVGVKVTAETTKSRYTKLGGTIKIDIPYDTGYDPLSGLLDMAVDADIVTQKGAWYSYVLDGKDVNFQRKNFIDHYQNIFEFDHEEHPAEEEDVNDA